MKHTTRVFRQAGVAVLAVSLDCPEGDRPADRHFAAMGAALLRYAQAVCLPDAVRAFETGRATGEGRFLCRRFRGSISEKSRGTGREIVLFVTLTAGGETLFAREVRTHWDAAGAYQLSRPKRMRKRRKIQENAEYSPTPLEKRREI